MTRLRAHDRRSVGASSWKTLVKDMSLPAAYELVDHFSRPILTGLAQKYKSKDISAIGALRASRSTIGSSAKREFLFVLKQD